MKKILMLHDGGLGGIRGTEICLIQAAEALYLNGFDIAIARNVPVIDESIAPFTKKIAYVCFPTILINGRYSKFPLWAFSREFRKLSSLVKLFQPNIIYTSGGSPCQYAVPLSNLYKVPVICHFHHPAATNYLKSWLIKHADHRIYPSQFTRNDVKQKLGVDGEVIYNGVDIDTLHPIESKDITWREKHQIPADAIVVGQVGALIAHKRPDLLIRAFAKAASKFEKLHLCLVGKGPLEPKLREQIATLGLSSRVTLTGFVESVLPYFQHVIDINVLASSEEGLGISVLEGSACGLPAIVTDCTGLRETIIEGVTGQSIPPDGEKMLSKKLIAMATNNELRQRLGQAGRTFMLEKFSENSYREEIVSAVLNLIEIQQPQ